MMELTAYSTLFMTLGLVVTRPRIASNGRRIAPVEAAGAGVVVMLLVGVVSLGDLGSAALLLWRPLLAIAAIMVTTSAAQRLEVLDWMAAVVEARAGGSAKRLFGLVFVLSAATSAVLNNDAAVLLLTPLVVALVRRRYPGRPGLLLPFSCAVFMAAGVAPLTVSNPMNMIVAEYAGITFNEYARVMLPISFAGWIVGFVVLRLLFRRALDAAPAAQAASKTTLAAPSAAQRGALGLLLGVLLAYPIVSSFGGPVWAVAVGGALFALLLVARAAGPSGSLFPAARRAGSPRASAVGEVLVSGVSWDILGFLLAVFVLAVGLRNVGVVERLSPLYARAGASGIGLLSALGSAVLNNHPMAITNMLVLDAVPSAGRREVLAALIGGDLGPRLLPMGSLAGLLWLESLRRMRAEVTLRQFVTIGAAVTAPTLAISLLLLAGWG